MRRYLFHTCASEIESTDLKFLYGVNTETRALVKRSTRAEDLKKGFKLERCRRYRLWSLCGRINRCGRVILEPNIFLLLSCLTNKLELLKWAREEKKCEWDEKTINTAAHQGNLEMVKYCVANKFRVYKFPIGWRTCACAAKNGHLEILKYLREEVKAPWDSDTAAWAALNGHLHVLEYLVERKYDKYDERACACAAVNGHLDCLKHLHETAKAPWDYWAVRLRSQEQPNRMCTIPPRQ